MIAGTRLISSLGAHVMCPPFRTLLSLLTLSILMPLPLWAQNPREKKVREDKAKVEADGYWIYNDLPTARAQAREANKPIIAILRCIPCEECVKLDDDLVNTDPTLRPLLDQFVRLRIISTNGLDLSLFEFDTDQSFAVFLMNADGTIYGRFGTRSHRTNWVGDVSLEGLARALEGALELHKGYPGNKAQLAGKRSGRKPLAPTPEQFPTLSSRYTDRLNYSGNVVQSCIHCHQIGDAVRDHYRKNREPIPEAVLFPYPHPKSLGLIFNPKERATLQEVTADSAGEKAGFQAGDRVVTLNGQPLLSLADVQWVLHNIPAEGGTVTAVVERNGSRNTRTITLPKGWRQWGDISWRVSTWGLRRMATGGLVIEEIEDGGKTRLKVKHVGQYGAHAAAKNAGFQVGDVIVSFDGKSDFTRETDLITHALWQRKPGERVPVEVQRGTRTLKLMLPMQE